MTGRTKKKLKVQNDSANLYLEDVSLDSAGRTMTTESSELTSLPKSKPGPSSTKAVTGL